MIRRTNVGSMETKSAAPSGTNAICAIIKGAIWRQDTRRTAAGTNWAEPSKEVKLPTAMPPTGPNNKANSGTANSPEPNPPV